MTFIVHAIGHIELNVTDPERVEREATDILGLHVTHRTPDQTWLSSNGRAAEVVLRRASENSTHLIGLEALSAEAVREASQRVEHAGCRIDSPVPSLPCTSEAVTFTTPEGLRFEIHTPVKDDINARRHPTLGVGPLRMDHMNIITPDPVATREQLHNIGGLRLSERLVNDSLSWMYGGNRQHHILGLVKGQVGLHHYSFEMPDAASYFKLGDLLDRADKQLMWGPGRHRPGDNIYCYYTDASGAMIECSSGMSLIADDKTYTPNIITNLERPGNVRALNVWGTSAPLEWRNHHFPFAAIR
jgi:catechol 2,3-dioxygenase-like lactoylglutathione lyase family enzyme